MTGRRGMLGLAAAGLVGCAAGPRDPAALACPAIPHPPLALPRFAAAVRRPGGPVIVAFGSSSTAGAGASAPWRSYPAALERRLRDLLGVPVTVMNRGAGGEAADNMIGRLDRDVLAEGPDLVIWQAGANAALRGMDPERFRRFLMQGLGQLRQAGIEVVLMDNQRAPRIAARPGNRAFDAILAEAASAVPGVALFSRGAAMDAWEAAGLPHGELLVSDGLHHNDRAYACIADLLARALADGARMPVPPD